VEIMAVEMDGQTVLMQDCPQCHGRGAVVCRYIPGHRPIQNLVDLGVPVGTTPVPFIGDRITLVGRAVPAVGCGVPLVRLPISLVRGSFSLTQPTLRSVMASHPSAAQPASFFARSRSRQAMRRPALRR